MALSCCIRSNPALSIPGVAGTGFCQKISSAAVVNRPGSWVWLIACGVRQIAGQLTRLAYMWLVFLQARVWLLFLAQRILIFSPPSGYTLGWPIELPRM